MHPLTRHASIRKQQRGISPETVDALLAHGAKEHDHRGALVVYFDKQTRSRMLSKVGAGHYKLMEGKLNAYAVVSNAGALITVGHRHKRINRH